MKRIAFLTAILLAGLIAGSASAQSTSGPGAFDIDSLLNEHPMVKGQNMRSDVIAWDSTSSVHLTQVETSVDMHHHATHDENVWIIRGAGRLTLGDQKIKVKAGQVVHIPRGTSHAFHNLGSNPAVVISVFSPGFDGKDRIYEEKAGK
jgi:mannose-6-phosphate isomerase-like protein (cupin superfamily)